MRFAGAEQASGDLGSHGITTIDRLHADRPDDRCGSGRFYHDEAQTTCPPKDDAQLAVVVRVAAYKSPSVVPTDRAANSSIVSLSWGRGGARRRLSVMAVARTLDECPQGVAL